MWQGNNDCFEAEEREADGIVQAEQNANQELSLILQDQSESVCPQRLASAWMSEEKRDFLEKSIQLFGLVNTQLGDYTGHEIDTRIDEGPSGSDIENINNIVSRILNQNLISRIENPLLKGWKKPSAQGGMKKKGNDKATKRVFEKKAKKLRREISIAKGKLDRLSKNRKLTKKGRKNRELVTIWRGLRRNFEHPNYSLFANGNSRNTLYGLLKEEQD